jgi:hypothetical protein
MRKELLVAALPMAFACSFGDPPSWDGASSVAPLPPSLATLPVAVTSAAAPVTTPPVASSAPPPAASSAKPPEPPSPEIGDPGKLPQTEEKPQAAGKDFDLRMTALWDAIVHDDPERAMGTYFPLAAYEQVKDIPNPPSDYKARLIASYKRDIHFFHKWLGPSAETAKFVRVEVPDRARWVPLHQELNKISYWRVFGTRMFFNDEGKERFIELSTMISWRGQWYVVHVRPVK